jgi:RimJ/RimL family protein N-acetyltransferase
MLPPLATPRLDLRPARPDDLDALHALWAAPEVRRYLFDDAPVTRERAAEVLAQAAALEGDGLGLWLASRRAAGRTGSGAMVGCAGLVRVTISAAHDPGLAGAVEPIVALAPEAWGQGLAREALAALLEHAFAGLGLARLAAVVDVPNERSDRLVRALGFAPTGEGPGPRYRMRSYALTRDGWATGRGRARVRPAER